MGKVRVNLTIDQEIVEMDKGLGLNLSKVSENYLKQAIKQMKQL